MLGLRILSRDAGSLFMSALKPLAKCQPRIVSSYAQECQEFLGMLSDRIGELRAADERGSEEAAIDLRALRDELHVTWEDFRPVAADEVANDNDGEA
jgi:hypothetical protein